MQREWKGNRPDQDQLVVAALVGEGDLLTYSGYCDVAMRDFGVMALGRLASGYDRA